MFQFQPKVNTHMFIKGCNIMLSNKMYDIYAYNQHLFLGTHNP